MAEYTPQSRILLEQWIKEGVMEKFDWTPHLIHIVQTLEGKTENEAKEREKELRQKLKNVIPCNYQTRSSHYIRICMPIQYIDMCNIQVLWIMRHK